MLNVPNVKVGRSNAFILRHHSNKSCSRTAESREEGWDGGPAGETRVRLKDKDGK